MSGRSNDHWDEVCNKVANGGFGSLAAEERTWVNIRMLIDAIENGGTISYFYNPSADQLSDCFASLQELRAGVIADQILRIAELFPDEAIHDLDERNRVIDSWPDGKYDALLEEVDEIVMPQMEELERALADYLDRNGIGA